MIVSLCDIIFMLDITDITAHKILSKFHII